MNIQTFKEKLQGSLRSLTMWFNTLAAGLTPGLDFAQSQVPALAAVLPANLYAWAFGIVAVANIFLRFFLTTMSLEAKAPPPKQPETVG